MDSSNLTNLTNSKMGNSNCFKNVSKARNDRDDDKLEIPLIIFRVAEIK